MFRTRILFILLALLTAFVGATTTITPKEPLILEGCYLIESREDLYGFAAIVNGTDGFMKDSHACGRLMNNILVNQDVLTSEGVLNVMDTANFVKWEPMKEFGGQFYGQGYFVSGLYYDNETQTDIGLFGSVLSAGNRDQVVIKDVGIVYSFFRGAANVGSVVGTVNAIKNSVTIHNTLNYSYIEAIDSTAGGIVGRALGMVNIENSGNKGYVAANRIVGGLVGRITGAPIMITNAYSEGVVESLDEENRIAFAGGIVGDATGTIEIKNAYNQGYVGGDNIKGGIAGRLSGDVVLLVNAYNAGIMYPLEQVEYSGAILGVFVGNEKKFKYANVYYENADGYNDAYGIKLPQDMMQDGTLAYLLHDYYYEGLDASVWGQNIDNSDPQEGDLYPRFGKKINGASTQNLESVTMHTGNDDEDFSLKYVPGYLLQLPEMSREGTAFLGWYDNAEYNGTNAEFIPTTATGPQEFWARFAKVWTISYWTGNEVTHIGENVQSYAEGVGVTLPKTVTQSGAVFNGWYDNKNLNGPRYYKVGPEATGDKQFYAKWLVKKEPAKDADGCYVIKDASELYGFAAIVNGTDGFTKNNSSCASLASDIVVNENVLKNDGSVNEKDSADFMRWTPMKEFMGVFDGKGHAISGLYYNVKSDMNTEMTGVGLIGSIRDGSFENPVVIKNVGVEASYFGGVYNVGALVGLVQGRGNNYIYVNISNSYSTSVTRASTNGGGLVGLMASNVFGLLENCYNVGKVFIKSEQQSGASLVGGKWGGIVVKNSYYLNYFGEAEYYGKSASGIQFENGTVAYALHNGENGSIWGQNVGEDPLPNFSGVVKNFTNSSSSSVSSSSSAKSSSSLGTSSSGKSSSSKANPVSSSGAKPSSSSAKAVSSSSGKSSSSVSGGELSSSSRASVPLSFGILCNGKKCNDALLVIADVPSFRVMAAGRKILVRGARVGSFFAVFDIQGQLIQSGYVGMADLAIIVPRSGHYLVRIGNQTKNVLIR